MDKTLRSLGLKEGQTVLAHTDLRGFRLPQGLQTHEEICRYYYEMFLRLLQGGTLAVPAYFYEYARFGQAFDVDCSPVSAPLGVFSQYVAKQPEAVRSLNPLQSIAAVGKHAEILCGGKSLSGYGAGSPWERLLELDGQILFFGAPFQVMTFVHYIEQRVGVPHLYFKAYPYPVVKNGTRVPGTVVSAVRYLKYHVEYRLERFRQKLLAENLLRSVEHNGVVLECVSAKDAFAIGAKCLDEDPYYFLKQPPEFVPGEIPIDGVTGALK